jgi:uncharacterized protein
MTFDEAARAFTEVYAPHARFGLLFGSILEERFNSQSDVDLAILFPRDLNLKQEIMLRQQLEEKLQRDIDVIDLRTADPIITWQVLQNGRLIFSTEIDEFHQFKARKISEYLDFKRSRAIVETHLVDIPIIGKRDEK